MDANGPDAPLTYRYAFFSGNILEKNVGQDKAAEYIELVLPCFLLHSDFQTEVDGVVLFPFQHARRSACNIRLDIIKSVSMSYRPDMSTYIKFRLENEAVHFMSNLCFESLSNQLKQNQIDIFADQCPFFKARQVYFRHRREIPEIFVPHREWIQASVDPTVRYGSVAHVDNLTANEIQTFFERPSTDMFVLEAYRYPNSSSILSRLSYFVGDNIVD